MTRRPIPLFPVPPNSPRRTLDKSLSTPSSDFPPIRIYEEHNPPAPIHSRPQARSPVQKYSQPRHGRTPNKGLGQKNCVNTVHTKDSAKHTKAPKLSLKRGLEAIDDPVKDDRPLKNRLICVEENDFDFLMGEIKNIREMMDQFSRDMDHRMGKLFYKVQQLS